MKLRFPKKKSKMVKNQQKLSKKIIFFTEIPNTNTKKSVMLFSDFSHGITLYKTVSVIYSDEVGDKADMENIIFFTPSQI